MRDITQNLNVFRNEYAAKCNSFKSGACIRPEGCSCALRAEVWAYIYALIPPDYHKLTINDFTGKLSPDGERVLDGEVVESAKNNIIKYCWGAKPPKISNQNKLEMLLKSVMGQRRKEGRSLVIHGQNVTYNTVNKKTMPVPKKVGRTLLAAIVMKEAIQRRMFDGHQADTYEWVQFPTLKARLMAKDAEATLEYQTADWLVVDGVIRDERTTDNMKAYANSMLDTVFMERIEARLPTIIVCNFDVDKTFDLESFVGVGMAQIIRDSNTLKISLSKKDE